MNDNSPITDANMNCYDIWYFYFKYFFPIWIHVKIYKAINHTKKKNLKMHETI